MLTSAKIICENVLKELSISFVEECIFENGVLTRDKVTVKVYIQSSWLSTLRSVRMGMRACGRSCVRPCVCVFVISAPFVKMAAKQRKIKDDRVYQTMLSERVQ